MPEILPGFYRVSEILAQWDRYGGIPNEIRERALAQGAHVHEEIELWTRGLSATQHPMLYSFQHFMGANDIIIMETETRYYDDKLKITGCVDAIINWDNELMVVDYKTSSKEDKKMWPLQGTFYYLLAKAKNQAISPRVLFLKLDKEGGSPKEFIYTVTDELINVCYSALNCYRYLNS